jgi:histidyl-tRNA synthetase
LYPEQSKLGRQLATVDDLQIPYALIIGSDELAQQKYTLKHLASGMQQQLDETGLLDLLSGSPTP